MGQLWYEIFDFSCNKSEEELDELIKYCSKHQMILCTHPHGILPFHAVTSAAYFDQYLHEIFGFGAAADVVFFIPILRNMVGWLSTGSATYHVLRDGLKEVAFHYHYNFSLFLKYKILIIKTIHTYRVNVIV